MRGLVLLMAMVATPAFAHHEVVAVASLLPLYFGLAAIAVAGLGAARGWIADAVRRWRVFRR